MNRKRTKPPPEPDCTLGVPRYVQPDDVTCGPTGLLQVLHFYGDDRGFGEIAARTPMNPDGGTLAVYLGLASLRLGYRATLYPYNMRIFDPTWSTLDRDSLEAKLRQRAAAVDNRKVARAAEAYALFLAEGGGIEFRDLSGDLLVEILDRDHPLLLGLSATYLYQAMRERTDDNQPDDVTGEPTGHFVVICGYGQGGRHFLVCDPSPHVPFGREGRYDVPAQRLLNSILLGDITYDAVLLEIWPGGGK